MGCSMNVPYPRKLEANELYAPLLALLNDTLLRPIEVAKRWRCGVDHLARLRQHAAGPPWLRLPGGRKADRPTGQVRYRLSEIVACELGGTTGALTLQRVYLAVSTCDFLTEAQRAAVIVKLESALGEVVREGLGLRRSWLLRQRVLSIDLTSTRSSLLLWLTNRQCRGSRLMCDILEVSHPPGRCRTGRRRAARTAAECDRAKR
jgi:hypothetical protein